MGWTFYNASGQQLKSAAAIPAPVFGRVVRTSAHITTTSTSLVDVTGATITFTTGAFPVQYAAAQSSQNDTINQGIYYNVMVDSTLLHGSSGLIFNSNTANKTGDTSFSGQTAALSAAEHTIKMQWKVEAGTGLTVADSGDAHMWSAFEIR